MNIKLNLTLVITQFWLNKLYIQTFVSETRFCLVFNLKIEYKSISNNTLINNLRNEENCYAILSFNPLLEMRN
jgi:hypothetical protein